MVRRIPIELTEKQGRIRLESMEKVQEKIDELKAEGFIVTTKLLMDRTGFARSTFSKHHIREVLKNNNVCKYAVTKSISRVLTEKETIKQLEDENLSLRKKVAQLEKERTDLINKENKSKVELTEVKEINKKLRGQLHVLIQTARIRGINIEA